MRQLDMMARNLAGRGFDGTTGVIFQMAGRVHQQADVMSFIDVFYLLTILFVSLAVFAVLMRKPSADAAEAGGH